MALLRDQGYWDHPYYQSEEYAAKLKGALQIEKNRQDLVAQKATKGAMAYALFLMACENDASLTSKKGFKFPSDSEVLREYPFLRDLVGVAD